MNRPTTARPAARRGVTLTELVVSVGLLAVTSITLLNWVGTERRSLDITEDRLVAQLLVQELQQVYGGFPLAYYQPRYPADEAGWNPLLESDVAAASAITPASDAEGGPAPGADAGGPSPTRAALTKRLAAMKARRFILFEDLGDVDGVPSGKVTFRVRYAPPGAAGERTADIVEVVTGTRSTP